MKFNTDEIASVIQREIEQFSDQVDVREVGTVLEVGDGIARVYGLSGVMAGEMVEFPGGIIGLAFNLAMLVPFFNALFIGPATAVAVSLLYFRFEKQVPPN